MALLSRTNSSSSLFLDGLKAELAEIKAVTVEKTRKARLEAFQRKLAGLTFLDPACGSGNFLTETYISLRRLENETISLLHFPWPTPTDEQKAKIEQTAQAILDARALYC